MSDLETYHFQSADGNIAFDSREHLPPDEASESLASHDAMLVLRGIAAGIDFDPSRQIRVLIPGIGVGTLACALLANEARQNTLQGAPVHIDGFDISGTAIDFARQNLEQFRDTRFSWSIDKADWQDPKCWNKYNDNYQLILFNPPYLPSREAQSLRPRYRQVPIETMDGGEDGLDHFRAVLPRLRHVMSDNSTLLFRYRVPGEEQTRKLQSICTEAFGALEWPSGLFPSEGEASYELDQDGRRRWISLGRIVGRQPDEPTTA